MLDDHFKGFILLVVQKVIRKNAAQGFELLGLAFLQHPNRSLAFFTSSIITLQAITNATCEGECQH